MAASPPPVLLTDPFSVQSRLRCSNGGCCLCWTGVPQGSAVRRGLSQCPLGYGKVQVYSRLQSASQLLECGWHWGFTTSSLGLSSPKGIGAQFLVLRKGHKGEVSSSRPADITAPQCFLKTVTHGISISASKGRRAGRWRQALFLGL